MHLIIYIILTLQNNLINIYWSLYYSINIKIDYDTNIH